MSIVESLKEPRISGGQRAGRFNTLELRLCFLVQVAHSWTSDIWQTVSKIRRFIARHNKNRGEESLILIASRREFTVARLKQ
jgi:hypothetical protein